MSEGSTPYSVVVGLTSTPVIAANPRRKGLVIVNTSSGLTGAAVSLGIDGNPPVLYAGITLFPSGGVWNMDATQYTQSAVTAVAALAGTVLSVQEF